MIHLIHGIHTQAAEGPLLALQPYLPQPVKYVEYGWIAALESRRWNPAIVGSVMPYVDPDDILIGHSNGCCIAYRIAREVKVKALVLINAALRSDVLLPDWLEKVDVYYNAGDKITEVAEFEAGLPIAPVDKLWGDMGHEGYKGTDPRVTSIDCGNTTGRLVVDGHSDIGMPAKMKDWGPYIGERVRALI